MIGESKMGAKTTKFFHWQTYLALTCFFTLSGCMTATGGRGVVIQNSIQEPNFVTRLEPQDLDVISAKSKQDVFNSQDIAHISVYNVEPLSGEFTVDGLGNIHLPLIGKTPVKGITTATLQETLEQKYGAQYLQNPSISVSIEKKEIGRIVVDGAVEAPGVFEVTETVYLSEAIALAGGVSDVADMKDLYVAREINGERNVQRVNLKDIRLHGAEDVILYPYDIVLVQDSNSRIAYNEFLKTIPLLSSIILAASRR